METGRKEKRESTSEFDLFQLFLNGSFRPMKLFLWIGLTLNYLPFNSNFIHLYVTLTCMFQRKFPFKDNKVIS